jgi:hypothetical protein
MALETEEFMRMHYEIGCYLNSKFPPGITIATAQSIAESLEEQFQEFGLRITPAVMDDQISVQMGLSGEDAMQALLTKIRTLKMELTDV